ncbi:histidine kinase [Paucibacter sp. APW11]|uniref:Histidine kinase n=1 Tax=Roseateles aquae TaxID=3077235 RepID=A0ABU3PFV7_9BURK|nr:histidine kinase [Paucibacter sp. APW11]MDT9000973.1 histidine kinase [Paucibacter sp. APW11]
MVNERSLTSPTGEQSRRGLWVAYAAVCLLVWLLHVLAGTEFQRGLWQVWESVYQATVSLWAAMLLGPMVQPWVCWLQRREWGLFAQLGLHMLAALLFGALWQACDFALAWALFGEDHASAMLAQDVLWRLIWGVFVYVSLSAGFTSWHNAQRARTSAVAAAQAESALARAELAAISGKLNPHFLFNTLNSLIALTRKDARAAEQGLLRFSGMLRYVLDTKRSATDRVALADELDFVRDYLALEALRLGQRLQVHWELDDATLNDEIPPLSLQPLVENSIIHGIAPRPQGGQLHISARRDALTQGLALSVSDDGPGCEPAQLDAHQSRSGIGLSALRQRFSLDYEGRARLRIHTAPGQGFRVDIWIPQAV